MAKDASRRHWQTQTMADDCEIIECPKYDDIKDFVLDPSGYYVLIRVNQEIKGIEVAMVNKNHVIEKIFIGRTPQELYHTIFSYEKKYNLNWFDNKDHVAYLGKEFKKAQIALEAGQQYVQE